RSMVVTKAKPLPVECIVRGYLVGSGWKEYAKSGTVCGMPMRKGYEQASQLDTPIFTPSTKAESGHDENISIDEMRRLVGTETADAVIDASIRLYAAAAQHARTRGIIIADTKFDFGTDANGTLVLGDEVLTPDSSRFWPAAEYKTGANPPSLDKQFVRDWLDSVAFNHNPPAPALPDDIVMKTRERYLEALRILAGK
ncbi:MAG: phosphoribosylaminoimidazolesuccinocarboxamide synthase, partial [Lentisphaerae bacterium]|nr:phosphoribosylaminoimidazolesuccinocarboxamide synthase [Lentisphaerota bacterium]